MKRPVFIVYREAKRFGPTGLSSGVYLKQHNKIHT
jgi:hypothetical protein